MTCSLIFIIYSFIVHVMSCTHIHKIKIALTQKSLTNRMALVTYVSKITLHFTKNFEINWHQPIWCHGKKRTPWFAKVTAIDQSQLLTVSVQGQWLRRTARLLGVVIKQFRLRRKFLFFFCTRCNSNLNSLFLLHNRTKEGEKIHRTVVIRVIV